MAPPTPSKSINHTTPSHDLLKGNSLIVNKSIARGEAILEIPNPLLSLLDNAALDRYCYECFTLGRPWNPTMEEYEDDKQISEGVEEGTNEKLVRCRDCMRVRWCKGCSGNHVRSRRKVGRGRHDAECLILQLIAKEKGSARFPTNMRQAAHVLKRYEEGYLPPALVPGVGEVEKSLWEGKSIKQVVEGMMNWQEKQEREPGKEELNLQARAVVKYSGLEMNVDNVEVAKTLVCTMNVNTYRISTSSSQHIGLCFDPYLSLINHSCVPNSYISFRGPAAVVRALLPIEEGEEVLVSYIDQNLARQQRHEKLKSRWHFECACEACEDKDWTAYRKFLRHATKPPREISVCGEGHWSLLNSIAKSSVCPTSRVGVSVLPQYEHFRAPHENWKSLTSIISQQPIAITTQTAALYPFPQLLTSLQELYTRVGQYEVAFLLQLCQVYWIDPLLHPGPYTPDKLYSIDRLARLLDLRYCDMGFDLHKLKSLNTSHAFNSSVENFNEMKYAKPLCLLHQKLRCWAEKILDKKDDFYRALVEKEEDRMLAWRMEGGPLPGQGGEDEVWVVLAELGRVEVVWEAVRSVDLRGSRGL